MHIIDLIGKAYLLFTALWFAISMPRGVTCRAFIRAGDAFFEVPPRPATVRERWIARWLAWPVAAGTAALLFVELPIYLWLPAAWAIGIIPTALARWVYDHYWRMSAARVAWQIRRYYSKRCTGTGK